MVGTVTLSVSIAILMSAAVVASFGLAWYSWTRADHPVADRFALLLLFDGLWALFALLRLVTPTDALAPLLAPAVATCAALAAVFWFRFVIEYTGDSEWIPAIVERLVLAQAVLYGVVYLVNPLNLGYVDAGVARYGVLRVPYEVFGPVAVAEIVVIYGILLCTFVLLGRFFLGTRSLYRKQTGLIFGSTLVVAVANVVYFAGFTPHPKLDLTPLFFAAQAVGIGVALYWYDFLDVVPLAARTLLEELADPVFVVDTSGRVVDWNRAAAAYVPANANRPSLTDISIPGLDAFVTATDGGIDTGGANSRTVLETSDDGTTFDVRTTSVADRYGIVRGHTIVLRDVTERQVQKRALEVQNDRLEEFTGVVSHDLRSPLQVIDGHLELARETGDLSHLTAAGEAVGRMECLIDDLLTLAREGKVIDERETIALETCCRRAWESVESEEVSLVVSTDRTVVSDGARLQQLFENLFRNCIEHAGTNVTITVGEFAEGFYVADDGPGISETEREDVFDLGVTSAEDGTGFGLAIVNRIVDAHGWSITVTESEEGGARFEVTVAGSTASETGD